MDKVHLKRRHGVLLAIAVGGTVALSLSVAGHDAPSSRAEAAPQSAPSTVGCVAAVPRQYLPGYYPSGYSYSRNAWGDGASPSEPAVTSP